VSYLSWCISNALLLVFAAQAKFAEEGRTLRVVAQQALELLSKV
jgi:hypothetical protein